MHYLHTHCILKIQKFQFPLVIKMFTPFFYLFYCKANTYSCAGKIHICESLFVILLLMLQTTAYKHEIPWHCRFVMFVSHKNCHLDQLTAVMCEIKVVYSILLFKTYCCKLTNNSSHYKITISYLEFWTFTDFIHYVECFYIRQSISEKRKYVVDINHWVLL